MVFKALDTCPNGQVPVKRMDDYPVSIQLRTQGPGQKADTVDKENSGKPLWEERCIGDQSRIE